MRHFHRGAAPAALLAGAVRFVQLSILLTSHRDDLMACSRTVRACSSASPKIEIIVDDNSGDTKKRELLALFQRDNSKIICVDFCAGLENFCEALRLAMGDFIFFLADCDSYFDRAIAKLQESVGQSFNTMLAEISGFFTLFSKQKGQHYFDFWNAVLNKRKPVTRPLTAAGGR